MSFVFFILIVMPASSQKCIYEIHKKITKRLIGACRKGKSKDRVKDTKKKEEELREPFQHKLLVKCKSKARRLQQEKY